MENTNLPPVKCRLVGTDGNAFALMAKWKAAARKAGWPSDAISELLRDAMSGDYDHLVATLATHCAKDCHGRTA